MTAHPALAPGWLCESCRPPAVDCPCDSWACECACQRFPQSPVDPLIRRADDIADMLARLVELDTRSCRHCGGEVADEVGLDEDLGDRAVVVRVRACQVCGVTA